MYNYLHLLFRSHFYLIHAGIRKSVGKSVFSFLSPSNRHGRLKQLCTGVDFGEHGTCGLQRGSGISGVIWQLGTVYGHLLICMGTMMMRLVSSFACGSVFTYFFLLLCQPCWSDCLSCFMFYQTANKQNVYES